MPFKNLGIEENINKILKEKLYTKPTLIQSKVIPLVLDNKDVIAQAQTGSGKSASFVLPILQNLFQKEVEGKSKIKVLVLTPTRELTQQIASLFSEFSVNLPKKLKVVSVTGGSGIGDQIYKIQQGCDILVATSGRFLDVLSKKQMNLSTIECLVLDEADRMLGDGFIEELDLILESIPKTRQNLMFSATYPQKMKELSQKITTDATEVKVESETLINPNINQRVIEVDKEKRGPLLRYLIKKHKWKSVLVFMANKRATDNIALKFRKYGFNSASFNADLDQELREETLEAFKNKEFNILFATDIAARGLDIDNIDCIINYDLPRSPSDYVHRIGRTARALSSGDAISFIDYESMDHFKLIEKRSDIKLKRETIEGFELSGDAPLKVKGPAPIKGKKKSKKDKLREKEALSKSN